jgi:hypothetical protein
MERFRLLKKEKLVDEDARALRRKCAVSRPKTQSTTANPARLCFRPAICLPIVLQACLFAHAKCVISDIDGWMENFSGPAKQALVPHWERTPDPPVPGPAAQTHPDPW